MKRLLIVLALAATACSTNERTVVVRASFVGVAGIIDPTHFHRRSADQVETVVLNQAGGGQLLAFHLDGQPTAKLRQGEMIRLYLSPGRHRFGVIPCSHTVLHTLWQMNAEVTRDTPQYYRIFQSSGFTSSGGNAVFEIAPLKSGAKSQ